VKKYMIHLNSRRCIGCHGCEVHCKTNKGLQVGPILCEISHTPPKKIAGVVRTEFIFQTCHHCEEPLCVTVCPSDAMVKREDSIVYIDQEKCIGCMACKTVCPWEIPEYNPETKTAVKCDLCMERLDTGLKPACVTKCTTHALELVRQQTA